MDNLGFVVAGYSLTAIALGGYAGYLFYREIRARRRASVILDSRRS